MGELLEPSPEQAVAEHLAEEPQDAKARLAFAELLVRRGQLELARKVVEGLPPDDPARKTLLDTLRARIERAPGALDRPVRFRWSAVRVFFLGLLLVGVLWLLTLVPGGLVELERRARVRSALTQLSSPDFTARVEAARIIMRIGQDHDLIEKAAAAIEPASLDERSAEVAIALLAGRSDAIARALSHPSAHVRMTAALALRGYTGPEFDRLVAASRVERDIALVLMGTIVRRGRPEDVELILDMAHGPDRDMRLAVLQGIGHALEGSRTPIFPELEAEAARVLRDGTAEEQSYVLAGSLAVGSDEALGLTLSKLRGRSMLGGRAIEAEARKLARYTREQLQNAYSAEADANARQVLARALRDKK